MDNQQLLDILKNVRLNSINRKWLIRLGIFTGLTAAVLIVLYKKNIALQRSLAELSTNSQLLANQIDDLNNSHGQKDTTISKQADLINNLQQQITNLSSQSAPTIL